MARKIDTAGAARHSIAVVSRMTGLTQLLLRAWERRYAAVVPERTPSGRRLYTDADVERLRLLKRLTDSGHRIGDVANLPPGELFELVEKTPPPEPIATPARPLPAVDALLGSALQAVADLDARALEGVLDQAAVALSRPVLRRALIVPLLLEVGERWRDGSLRVSHEHMASAIVRSFLAGLNQGRTAPPGAPVLVVGTPAGQMHELGALLASNQAVEAGLEPLYLGPNLPPDEIAGAALARGARAVLLSLVYPPADPATVEQLRVLRRLLGEEMPILVGGQATDSYAATLREIGAITIDTPESLDAQLKSIS